MEDLTQWFLINVLSPLMLPLFLVGMLCMIAGVRPEPVINGVLSIFADIIKFSFGLIALLIKTCGGAVKGRK